MAGKIKEYKDSIWSLINQVEYEKGVDPNKYYVVLTKEKIFLSPAFANIEVGQFDSILQGFAREDIEWESKLVNVPQTCDFCEETERGGEQEVLECGKCGKGLTDYVSKV